MVQALLIVVVVGIALPVAWLLHRAEQRRRRQAQALAASLGYHMDLETKDPPRLGFELFDSGRSKKVTYHTWRDGSPDNVFQYQYTTGSGKNRRVHERTAALVHVPFSAPHLEIGPEGFWSAFGRAIGIRDIEIESEEFNDRYRVRCDDERFAIALLDHDMIAWMISPHSGGGSVKFEFVGRWMLCWGDQLEYRHLIPLLEWAQQARTNLPTVLTSLYPPS